MTPDDPRHGSRAGYLAGCAEQCCRLANFRDVKARRVRVEREGPQRVNCASVVKELVRYWDLRGVSAAAIARAAGVSTDVLTAVVHGERDRILQTSLRKIIAVTEADLPGDALLYSRISQVRVYSMMASGHPLKWICQQSPELQYAGNWRRQERIRAGMARAIRDLYQSAPGVGPSKFTIARSKNYGYLPMAAWDDPGHLTMPDGWEPTATPIELPEEDIDHVLIDRRLSGDRSVTLNLDEKHVLVEKALGQGRSHQWIEDITGLKAARYMVKPDAPTDQNHRRADLLEAVATFEKNPGRRRHATDDVQLVLRRGIWVADRRAA